MGVQRRAFQAMKITSKDARGAGFCEQGRLHYKEARVGLPSYPVFPRRIGAPRQLGRRGARAPRPPTPPGIRFRTTAVPVLALC